MPDATHDTLREQVADECSVYPFGLLSDASKQDALRHADVIIGAVRRDLRERIGRVPQHHGGDPISMAQYRADVLAVVEAERPQGRDAHGNAVPEQASETGGAG